jgi:hypothetical protein
MQILKGSKRFTGFASRFTRRSSGGLARRPFYPPSFWRTGGFEHKFNFSRHNL